MALGRGLQGKAQSNPPGLAPPEAGFAEELQIRARKNCPGPETMSLPALLIGGEGVAGPLSGMLALHHMTLTDARG